MPSPSYHHCLIEVAICLQVVALANQKLLGLNPVSYKLIPPLLLICQCILVLNLGAILDVLFSYSSFIFFLLKYCDGYECSKKLMLMVELYLWDIH
jgi:ABC-type Na+ efflux pump permease subunit